MKKICVIGCGRHSSKVHGPSFKRYNEEKGDVEFLACCDMHEESAQKYSRLFGFKTYYTDYKKMLLEEKPDAVCVILPDNVVKEVAQYVMQQGIHILCEKPIGDNTKECIELIEIANKSGVINQAAFNRRYQELLNIMREKIGGDEILMVSCELYRHNRYDQFHHTIIHPIDTMRYIVGKDYQSLNFKYQTVGDAQKSTENIYMNGRFENETVANLSVLPCTGVLIERYTVSCKDKCYMLNTVGYDAPGKLFVFYENKLIECIDGKGEEEYLNGGFYAENADFFNNIISNNFSPNNFASTLQTMQIGEIVKNHETNYCRG